jgi:glycosyltransferase involved in cell wall biosynthesis
MTAIASDSVDSRRKVIVVMPAYNAARTLKRTFDELPLDKVDHVILVDDGSRDDTIEIAKTLGLTVFTHTRNFGYGANQKTCYTEALKTDATIVVMVHPDYQYDPTLLPKLIGPVEEGTADVVFGSRMMGVSAFRQGMPWWKYLANKSLTYLENRVFGLHLSEFHTGYRAYSRKALDLVNFRANSDGFIFDQEIVAQMVECGLCIAEVSVPVRYFPEASSTNFIASTLYGLGILWLLFRYSLHRAGLWRCVQFVAHTSRYHPV